MPLKYSFLILRLSPKTNQMAKPYYLKSLFAAALSASREEEEERARKKEERERARSEQLTTRVLPIRSAAQLTSRSMCRINPIIQRGKVQRAFKRMEDLGFSCLPQLLILCQPKQTSENDWTLQHESAVRVGTHDTGQEVYKLLTYGLDDLSPFYTEETAEGAGGGDVAPKLKWKWSSIVNVKPYFFLLGCDLPIVGMEPHQMSVVVLPPVDGRRIFILLNGYTFEFSQLAAMKIILREIIGNSTDRIYIWPNEVSAGESYNLQGDALESECQTLAFTLAEKLMLNNAFAWRSDIVLLVREVYEKYNGGVRLEEYNEWIKIWGGKSKKRNASRRGPRRTRGARFSRGARKSRGARLSRKARR
jgi:hypothetical protein